MHAVCVLAVGWGVERDFAVHERDFAQSGILLCTHCCVPSRQLLGGRWVAFSSWLLQISLPHKSAWTRAFISGVNTSGQGSAVGRVYV